MYRIENLGDENIGHDLTESDEVRALHEALKVLNWHLVEPKKAMPEIGDMDNFCGYQMTEAQVSKVSDMLTEDILERYDNPEYLNYDIVEDFAYDNGLKPAE